MMSINSTLEFKNALRSGPYAWPGGYPMFFFCDDGAALCCKCARSEAVQIMRSINAKAKDGWRVVGADINYEDNSLFCDHCNEQIESAYGE